MNYDKFEFLVMAMRACNEVATSQSLMNIIFHDFMDAFVMVYIHDLLAFSKAKESFVNI